MYNRMVDLNLFTLFHHDLGYVDDLFGFHTEDFLQHAKKPQKHNIAYVADVLYTLVTDKLKDFSDHQVSMTLTGGMDSRLVLACLLKAGVKPNAIVYGSPAARDVVFTENLCRRLGLGFHNAASVQPDKEWYYKWVAETIKRDGGYSHLHRAHRTAAIAEHAELYKPLLLFTGHMGGEGLRGLTYNNYFVSSFFEAVNEGRESVVQAAKRVLNEYFIKTENVDFEKLTADIKELPWMKYDKETNKLFFLYDLIAKIHHAQDIRLYKTYIPEVVPVYLQEVYLKTLFSSEYNFYSRKDKPANRFHNPEFYCKAIEYLYPPLLNFPFVNGFTPREYLRGLWYYVPVKLYRDRQKKNYPPTFSYGKWYQDFVNEHAENINPHIWEIYDKEKYFDALRKNTHREDEGYWHKFSNPIFFDLVDKFEQGNL